MNLEYRVEPLGASHDRITFNSGVVELDHYFRHQAGQDARRRVAAPFVMLDRQDAIVGYYTLSACGLQLSEFPETIARKLPRYPVLPATLLGRLAISRSHQGKNLGRVLLLDALNRSWRKPLRSDRLGSRWTRWTRKRVHSICTTNSYSSVTVQTGSSGQ
jgi:GNAT superfamily N-acetyltransferase